MGAKAAGRDTGDGRTRRPRRPSAAFLAAGRRSARVTLAAGAGFYLFLYGLGQPVAATYALFAAVALAGLSHIPGTGRQRAAVLLRLVPVAWLLVAAGTFLAVRTWSAVAGMLVIGFALAFVAVAAPVRPARPGTPTALHPAVLPALRPRPDGRAADRRDRRHPAADPRRGIRPPRTGSRAVPRAHRPRGRRGGAVHRRADQRPLRPVAVHGEGRRERGRGTPSLASPGSGAPGRTRGPLPRPGPCRPRGTHPVEPAGPAARPPAGPRPHRAGPGAAARRRTVHRGQRLAAVGEPPAGPDVTPATERAALAAAPTRAALPVALHRRADLLDLADAASALTRAAGLAVRGRERASGLPLGRFWYAHMRAPRLWWRRLVGHAGSRSVFFQNAVRISLALAAARAVAGLDTLPHGFWAMLATLSLTRTTLVATRKSTRQAVTGTLIGALFTAGVFALVGTDTTVYAVVLLPVLLVTFTVGPVKGVGWAQALFAITVALVFAQLAPATWRLAEARVLDVVIGSVIGAVFGLLAWPRGAQEEVRRSAAVLLRSAAETVIMTSSAVAAGGVRAPGAPPPGALLRHSLVLAESAFAQYQSEPMSPPSATSRPGSPSGSPPGQPDWQAVLLAGHHTLWGAERVLEPEPEPEPRGAAAAVTVPPLEPAAAVALTRLGERVAGRMLLLSAALDALGYAPWPETPVGRPGPGTTEVEPAPTGTGYHTADAWLHSLLADLERLAGAAPAPACEGAGPEAAGGPADT